MTKTTPKLRDHFIKHLWLTANHPIGQKRRDALWRRAQEHCTHASATPEQIERVYTWLTTSQSKSLFGGISPLDAIYHYPQMRKIMQENLNIAIANITGYQKRLNVEEMPVGIRHHGAVVTHDPSNIVNNSLV